MVMMGSLALSFDPFSSFSSDSFSHPNSHSLTLKGWTDKNRRPVSMKTATLFIFFETKFYNPKIICTSHMNCSAQKNKIHSRRLHIWWITITQTQQTHSWIISICWFFMSSLPILKCVRVCVCSCVTDTIFTLYACIKSDENILFYFIDSSMCATYTFCTSFCHPF